MSSDLKRAIQRKRARLLSDAGIFVTCFLPLQNYAQIEPGHLQSTLFWQSDFHVSTDLIVLLIAACAAGIAIFELNRHRRAAEQELNLDKQRFTAEQAEREKRLELEERRFNAEEGDRARAVRFRQEEVHRFEKPTVEIAEHLTRLLCEDPYWAARALEKARFIPYTNSLFGERSEHFHAEKAELARQFTRYLLRRCEVLAENNRHVFLLIDAGTTLFPFFGTIGLETAKRAQRGDDWIKRLHLATNNLPGIGELIKSGKRVPWDRYTKLAIEDCHLLPGIPLPIFAALAGKETNDAIGRLRQRFTEEHVDAGVTFIALVVGNWVRIRRKDPPCPIPMARGAEHREVKQTFVNYADEVFVVSPLGKIFVGRSNAEVNAALGFDKPSNDPDREQYQDVDIDDEKAKKVKLVSTTRAAERLLHEHSSNVAFTLHNVRKTAGGDEEEFARGRIEEIPHLLFPFGELPQTKYEEFVVEFPHEHTRIDQAVLREFQVDRQSI
jgi:hypothetical protein